MTLELKEFLEDLQYVYNYSEKTVDSYRRDIEKVYDFFLSEGSTMEEGDNIIIRNFLNKELEEGISARSCSRRLSALRHYFRFLKKKDYIKKNPFTTIKSPKNPIKYPDTLYLEDVETLLSKNNERTDYLKLRDQAILELLYASGVRASELVNIDINDIDFRTRTIRIIGKGNKERIVPFSKSCKVVLEQYCDNFRDDLIKKNKDDFNVDSLFLNANGKRLTVRGLEYILKEIEAKTGLFLSLHPHKLQHKFTHT